jgi:hypothetical protein
LERRRSPLSGWGSRRAAQRARREFVRQEIAAKVAPPVPEALVPEVVVPQAPVEQPVAVAVLEVPPVQVSEEPDEVFQPLLERLAPYSARPAQIIVH